RIPFERAALDRVLVDAACGLVRPGLHFAGCYVRRHVAAPTVDPTSLAAQAVEWRRHLHRHPELSFHEHETAQFIEDTLASFGGLELSRPTPTSVLARLVTGRPGPVLAP